MSVKRIDAHLSSLGYCTRKDAKRFLQLNILTANNQRIFDPSQKFSHSDLLLNDEKLDPEKILILMNKPEGYICSHNDAGVLIYSLLPERFRLRNPKISTIGRLDADTTGAILLTDDGSLNHKFANPNKKIPKIYEATLADDLNGDEIEIFASGKLMLKNDEKPLEQAKLEIVGPKIARLEITEGRYHQVKRMFAAVGNKVVKLHRISFAGFSVSHLANGKFQFIDI